MLNKYIYKFNELLDINKLCNINNITYNFNELLDINKLFEINNINAVFLKNKLFNTSPFEFFTHFLPLDHLNLNFFLYMIIISFIVTIVSIIFLLISKLGKSFFMNRLGNVNTNTNEDDFNPFNDDNNNDNNNLGSAIVALGAAAASSSGEENASSHNRRYEPIFDIKNISTDSYEFTVLDKYRDYYAHTHVHLIDGSTREDVLDQRKINDLRHIFELNAPQLPGLNLNWEKLAELYVITWDKNWLGSTRNILPVELLQDNILSTRSGDVSFGIHIAQRYLTVVDGLNREQLSEYMKMLDFVNEKQICRLEELNRSNPNN